MFFFCDINPLLSVLRCPIHLCFDLWDIYRAISEQLDPLFNQDGDLAVRTREHDTFARAMLDGVEFVTAQTPFKDKGENRS